MSKDNSIVLVSLDKAQILDYSKMVYNDIAHQRNLKENIQLPIYEIEKNVIWEIFFSNFNELSALKALKYSSKAFDDSIDTVKHKDFLINTAKSNLLKKIYTN